MDVQQEQTISELDWDSFALKRMLNDNGLEWILENLIDMEYDAQVTEPHIAHAHLKRYTALVKIKRELYGVNDK